MMEANPVAAKMPTGRIAGMRIADLAFAAAIVILIVFASVGSDTFLTQRNIVAISRQIVTNGFLSLGMLVVVYDDHAYGAEVHIFHGDPQKEIVTFPDTDIAAIARGYGCEAITVRSLDDLGPLQAWLDGPRDRPFLIDAKIEGFPSPVMEMDMH